MSQLKLANTLTKSVDQFLPYEDSHVRIYSCGPTVYDHVHIGNLSAFITADILRRVVAASYPSVTHVMNFTDVDDKTIRRSRELYPDIEPIDALTRLTVDYGQKFLSDMELVGNDIEAIDFIKATDPATIEQMQSLIIELFDNGFAYKASDGIYFDINAYRKSGKKYGQLVELTEANTSNQRIQNDEYDKDSVHDFALWKLKKPGEPFWDFTIDGQNLPGRPGWHIECSAMSKLKLGQPFDIHTGGIDLAFPHHENEIAQSTAGALEPTYAKFFVHNQHVLVDNKKMSKSLGNFYTLKDLIEKKVSPLAFRLLVLQSHYSKPTNFSFHDVEAANNRLSNWRAVASLRHQIHTTIEPKHQELPSPAVSQLLLEAMQNNLDTASALKLVDQCFNQINASKLTSLNHDHLTDLLEVIDSLLGLRLIESTPDIADDYKQIILERTQAREAKDWQKSDQLRDQLLAAGIVVRDSPDGPIWSYQ